MARVSFGAVIPKNGLKFQVDAFNKKSIKVSDTTWKDLSGNGYDLTLINGATYSTNVNSPSVSFDGLTQYARRDFAYDPTGDSEHTFSTWIYFNSGGSDSRFFWHGHYGVMSYKDGADRIKYYTRSSLLTQENSMEYSINIGEWMFISGTWAVNGDKKLYHNGVVVDTSTHGGTLLPSNNNSRITLGLETTTVRQFNGYMNDVMIYNRCLSPKEIYQIYNTQRGKYGVFDNI